MYFRNYRLQKAWLLKWLTSPMSEQIWTVNILKRLKHCRNLHSNSLFIFFDHSERTSL